MGNFDFYSKKFVKSLSFTTITKDRTNCKYVKINGRKYIKFGIDQAVTIVGNLFKDDNGNRILFVGISKQHPCDSKCDKNIAYEYANIRSLMNPDIVFYTVPKHITKFNFREMMKWYIDGMDLDFIKTREEIESVGDNPEKYYR